MEIKDLLKFRLLEFTCFSETVSVVNDGHFIVVRIEKPSLSAIPFMLFDKFKLDIVSLFFSDGIYEIRLVRSL